MLNQDVSETEGKPVPVDKLDVQQVQTNGHSSTHTHLYLQTGCTTGTD